MEGKLVKRESQLKIFNLGNKQISTIITSVDDALSQSFQWSAVHGRHVGDLVKLQILIEFMVGPDIPHF